jgi:hypothetical protein
MKAAKILARESLRDRPEAAAEVIQAVSLVTAMV